MSENITNEELVRIYKDQNKCGNVADADQTLKIILEKNKGIVERLIDAVFTEHAYLSFADREDLEQIADMAIYKAAETYDETKAQFNTVAYASIQFALKDWIRKNHIIGIPLQKQWQCSKYYNIVQDYKQKHNGKIPPDEYILGTMGVDIATYRDIKAAMRAYRIESLNIEIESGDGTVQIGDLIEDPRDCFEGVINKVNEDMIKSHVKTLKNKDEEGVIIDYFFNNIEISEIGVAKNLSRQRVNNIKNNGLWHLRQIKGFEDAVKGII